VPNLKLEDHPLSFVCGYLCNIFAANLHSWKPFLHPKPEDAPCCGDSDPPNMGSKQHVLEIRGMHVMKKATKCVGKKLRSCRWKQTRPIGNTKHPSKCISQVIRSVNPAWTSLPLSSRSRKTTAASSVDYA
jgi:hypothetical protein